MMQRHRKQPYRVVYQFGGKSCRRAYWTESAAHISASEAAHARRDWPDDTRAVQVLHVANDGTESVLAIYAGAQWDAT